MQTWQMQDAKASMSELVRCAQNEPQDITMHGKSVAVVISRTTFDRLLEPRHASLADFMQRSPLFDADGVAFERDTSPTREMGS